MSNPKKGLGRGFDSLIPTDLFDESFDPTAKQDEKISQLRTIAINKVVPDPDQPRRHFDEFALEELASSIRIHGILQPIVAIPEGDLFRIVAGERRYRAAKLAGLVELPVIVRSLSNQHKLELSLIENIQRRDLNPLETATAYLKLRDQFNLTLDQIGERVGGKSISAVSNTLRLLRLPEIVKTALLEGKITEGQARPLVGLEEATVVALLDRIIKEEWSARKIEQYIVALKREGRQATGQNKKSVATVDYGSFEKRLTQHLSANVHINANAKGVGKITISFKDDGEFQRIKSFLEK